MAKIFIFTGVVFIIIGLILYFFKDFPLFHLPGDIVIQKENFSFYFPITSSIINFNCFKCYFLYHIKDYALRLFIATPIKLPIYQAIKNDFKDVIDGKWVEGWNLHLTHKFIGEDEPEKYKIKNKILDLHV
ncbi:DUF2905 family protein [Lebetimonas sp. JH292]|uniref:DUF2905 family protein n=1 Tax=Lebetimonas sp. JH292 TaxID=990068 RepID=UPI0004B11855|nr:DUF2905 family protein [Lebetimonas sp. JH292]